MKPWRGNTFGNASGRREWRSGRAGHQREAKRPCAYFQRAQGCRNGAACQFSHEILSTNDNQRPAQARKLDAEETPEQVRAQADYILWKQIIRNRPLTNDAQSAEKFWKKSLEILDGNEREWKHHLAKDLDDQDLYGREHIRATIAHVAVLSKAAFYAVSYFLQTMTHVSVLECLSIDTFVGGLYNFFSGANGSRAIPTLQRFCDRVLEKMNTNPDEEFEDIETAAIALSTGLRELLKREQRARLNDDLLPLVDSVEALSTSLAQRGLPVASALLTHHISEIRAVVDRARGLISLEDGGNAADFADTPASVYPRGLYIPEGRHDNEKLDIAAVKIFPTSSEILNEAAECLPSTDPDQPHFLTNKSQRHIDTQFRLLRHDTFGELKEVLAIALRASETDRSYLDSPKFNLGNVRANRYAQATIHYISFGSRRGMEADISFLQPTNIRGKPASEIQRWWKDSRRLSEGVLVSFIAIHKARVHHLFLIISNRKTDDKRGDSLANNKHHGSIAARLANIGKSDIETLVGLSGSKARGVLVEFPGSIPATFVPILENLQRMQGLGSLPFNAWILPDRTKPGHETTTANIPPPQYARRQGFAFSLKPIMRNNTANEADFVIDPNSVSDTKGLIKKMEAETDLDSGQCQALFAALTREFALIQGPPGTGKSYLGIKLMQVLLNCQKEAHLGPILVICYTNHALDQFLEQVLREGTKKIIRIGGQSHSTCLEGHNLRTVSQMESKGKAEGYLLAKSYEALDKTTKGIERLLGGAHSALRQMQWKSIRWYLSQHHPRIHDQFPTIDRDGFKTVGRHPFDIWASPETTDAGASENQNPETGIDSETVLRKANTDVYSLSSSERRHLREFFSTESHKQAVDNLYEEVQKASLSQLEVSKIHDEVDRRVLQNADVIGITTTGLAKRISTLQRLRCKVVICEEAGEVMEPHILSALLPSVEHFIQIGDHEQLRPQINNFGLSLESKQGGLYKLDRSQFERLSVGIPGRPKIPVAQLEIQRRMRPVMSQLIRVTIYPNIKDHPSIRCLPDVVGMRKNLFWLDHDHPEDGQCSELHHKSHSNAWEAEMIHALVRHIVRQGVYSSGDIAVLTPYTGQLQKLRAAMSSDFEIVLSDRDQDALDKDGFNDAELISTGDLSQDSSAQKKVSWPKRS